MLKIGTKVIDIYDNTRGVISRIEMIAGIKTFYIQKLRGHETALYEDEIKEIV